MQSGFITVLTLSFRDIEEILAIRGIQTSYESISRWCLKYPRNYTKSLRKHQAKLGDIQHLDEVLISVGGERQYLWGAVDQDGDIIDILVQSRRNKFVAAFWSSLSICVLEDILRLPSLEGKRKTHE